jgi:N-acetylglucosamine-6-phosphate deacetylase
MMNVLTAAELYTPVERIRNAVLVVEDGVVRRVGSQGAVEVPPNARVDDFGDAVLAPGLIDIHIHGGAGHDVMEGTPEALAAIERKIFEHGVTTYVPTTVTAPLDATLRSLERLADAIERAGTDAADERAQPIGIHLEGPFISHTRRGVHPPKYISDPSVELFDRMWQAARGHVMLMTVAPEMPAALDLIRAATERGVCCSIGHSDADTAAARAGVRAGAHHATHTFNAMRPLDHREPGVLGVVLADSHLTADIIVDGIHVDPSVVELFLKAKGVERAVLITDAMSATGMGDGRYRLGSFEVEVRGGRATHEGQLAGSVLTLDLAIRNVMSFANWELHPAVRLATLNPAHVIRSADRGSLHTGARADVVVLSHDGDVIETFAASELA